MKNIHIGTSGWQYNHWQEIFYPPDLPQKNMLDYYAKNFSTVEINNTFYQLPSQKTVVNWKNRTPEDFLFAVKASRYITHMKNLKESKKPLHQFINRMKNLGKKLGPILFQLPPGWHKNKERLEEFVKFLPKNQRFGFEFRHFSWYDKDVLSLLENNNLALVVHDHADGPTPEQAIKMTADFAYLRLHGPGGSYSRKYNQAQLNSWLKKITSWKQKGKDVFVYFNNDAHGYAVENAQRLKELVV